MSVIFREIEQKDNEVVRDLIRETLEEFQVPKTGTAYADKSLDDMYHAYCLKDKAIFYVLELEGVVVGCAGIAPLDHYDGPICELQKMYFRSNARGRGLGSHMMKLCLEQARTNGFKQVYIETMPQMKSALKLYEKTGFYYINSSVGNTGHCSCEVYMLLDL